MSGTSEFRCGVCGGPVRAPYHAPRRPEIGPDMDMRPGEPVRSTLRDWVQACGKCGAAAWDLTTLSPDARTVTESAPYRSLSLEAAEDTLLFRRWAMICQAAGESGMAAEATLMGAWAADDGADMAEAAKLRRDVAALWGNPADLAIALRLLDVLRRAGEFGAVETQAQRLAGQDLDGFARAVVAFHRDSAAARDASRHLLSSSVPSHALPADLPMPRFWPLLFAD
jgi:hypothetical protein